MNHQQTSKSAHTMTLKSLVLLSALFISACDGGIFGTGGPNENIYIDNADSASNVNPDSNETSANGTDGDTSGADSGTTGGAPITGGTTGGASGIGGGGGGGDSGSDTGATGQGNETDAGTPDQGSSSSGLVSSGDDGARFVNTTTTLDSADTRVNLVNTTSLTLNIFETSVNPATLLFAASGVAPSVISPTATLTNSVTSLDIIDNNNVSQTLLSYAEFDASAATLTTIVVRNANVGISAIALATETQTTDQSLSRVRVVQAGTLGDASVESTIQVQSAGSNPGGVNDVFKPVSYASPQTDYLELPAGDYELIDGQDRLAPQAISLSGGSVYTVVLLGNGDNSVLVINDSDSAR